MEGKDLLSDQPRDVEETLSKTMWKYQDYKRQSEYRRKVMLKEKFAKQQAIKMSKKTENDLGNYMINIEILVL